MNSVTVSALIIFKNIFNPICICSSTPSKDPIILSFYRFYKDLGAA